MAPALTARISATWRGWSGRLYPCAIKSTAEANPDPDGPPLVAVPVARSKDGLGIAVGQPLAGCLTQGMIDAARRSSASELHLYALSDSDDVRTLVADLRRSG